MNDNIKKTILIVDDEDSLVTLLKYNLRAAGFITIIAKDGREAVNVAVSEKPDLILMDWMLPEKSGVDACKEIKFIDELKETPIIMVSARGEEEDKVLSLNSGADDYITKPFSPKELIARVNANIRQSNSKIKTDDIIVYSDVQIDKNSHVVKRNKTIINLGPKEYKLLLFLIENKGKIMSRKCLLDSIWNNGVFVEERTVDVHIRRLRKSLNKFGKDFIKTVHGSGYIVY